MKQRERYQNGSIRGEPRKHGAAVWTLRWREQDAQGRTVRRKEVIGTVEEYPTKASAQKACQFRRSTINRETKAPRTIAELVTHYREKEMTESSNKSHSTRTAYAVYLRNWIVPKWGEFSLSEVRTVAVEDWLRTIKLSNGSKAKIRNLMSGLFNHAMRNEWTDKNPIQLVRQSAKRESAPDVLTAGEIKLLLSKPDGAYCVMTFLAAVTGLRVSELLALKWEDVDFAAGEIRLARAIVCQHVGPLKTEASQKPVAMDAGLSALLLDWRGRCP